MALSPEDVYDLADDERSGYGGRTTRNNRALADLLEMVAKRMEDDDVDWQEALEDFDYDDLYPKAKRLLSRSDGP